MIFTIQRENLLKPLQAVASIVERRQTLPILGNLLLDATEEQLSITATDLELQLVGTTALMAAEPGKITVPARKLLEICRALPEGTALKFELKEEKLFVRAGKSRYTLTTLSAADFPAVEKKHDGISFSLPQNLLKKLISQTHFAMAINDVRYFLMGLLLEVETGILRTCATDGHRLALSEANAEINLAESVQVIVPRKGVGELARLLQDSDDLIELIFSENHLQVILPDIIFTSKLIDGRFPDYQRVIPENTPKTAVTERDELRKALSRAAILTNEKFYGVRLQFSEENCKILATNVDNEEAEEEIDAEYQGDAQIEIGFNVNYLLDALGGIEDTHVMLSFTNSDSSVLIKGGTNNSKARYVVMPMRL